MSGLEHDVASRAESRESLLPKNRMMQVGDEDVLSTSARLALCGPAHALGDRVERRIRFEQVQQLIRAFQTTSPVLIFSHALSHPLTYRKVAAEYNVTIDHVL